MLCGSGLYFDHCEFLSRVKCFYFRVVSCLINVVFVEALGKETIMLCLFICDYNNSCGSSIVGCKEIGEDCKVFQALG